jgi:hypothetical protein
MSLTAVAASADGLIETTRLLLVGVLLLKAVLLIGTRTFVSGK